MEDAPDFDDRLWSFLNAVPRGDNFFRVSVRQVGAGIGNHAVATAYWRQLGGMVADDAVVADLR